MKETVLSLDISTKTGWSVMTMDSGGFDLVAYGRIGPLAMPIDIPYPGSFVVWAKNMFTEILALIKKYSPDMIVIEETSGGSKTSHSQKILEWNQFLVAEFIYNNNLKVTYFLTEEWRRDVGCKMDKAEKDKNKSVREYKKKNNTIIAYDKDGKRTGIISRKHVNVRRANEVFGKFLKEPLKQKNEDTADSLLLGYSYYLRRKKYYEQQLLE